MRKLILRYRYYVAAAASVVGITTCVLIETGGASAQAPVSAAQPSAAAATVGQLIPSSNTTVLATSPEIPTQSGLVPSAGNAGAEQMEIAVPAQSLTPTAATTSTVQSATGIPSEDAASMAHELAWHAALAAAQAGLANKNIVSYQVSLTGEVLPPAEQGTFSGIIRTAVGAAEDGGSMPNIGSVAYSTLMAQVQSNLTTLSSVLPAGTIVGTQIVPVALNPTSDDYAFEIDLKVDDLSALQGHVGDVVDGLDTGLTGGPTAPTEGVAINLVDSAGRRVGWWSATRAAVGSATGDPMLSVYGGSETTSFPDLTGGPDPTSSASGVGGQSASAGFAIRPTRGIGPVSIGERQAAVAAALGTRTHRCRRICAVTYDEPQGSLRITYRRGVVDQITSTSRQLTLGGIALRAGPARLKAVLRKWTYESCIGYIYGRGPSTALTFRRGGAVLVDVTPMRDGGCGLP